MLIASLLITVSAHLNIMTALRPARLRQPPEIINLQRKIHELETQKEFKENHNASKSALKAISCRIKLLKDELLIARCHYLSGISSIISLFLLPCNIPAFGRHVSDPFIREGCGTCASHPDQSYLSIAPRGEVYFYNHYTQKIDNGRVDYIKRNYASDMQIKNVLKCKQLMLRNKPIGPYNSPVTLSNGKRTLTLKATQVCPYRLRNNYSLKLPNNRSYDEKNEVNWYQQCYNPEANHDLTTKHTCKHHFIIALGQSPRFGRELFVWSAADGALIRQYSIPSYMKLLTYKNIDIQEQSVFSTIGIDGFLWWMNTNNGRLARLDRRGIWETMPESLNPHTVWHVMSSNAQWLLERLETDGIQTKFQRTSCANTTLQAPHNAQEFMAFQKQPTLWPVTTALWITTLFEHVNHSEAPINMQPRWVSRYHNLKLLLANHHITLLQGLQSRIQEGTRKLRILIEKPVVRKGKKRKDR